MGTQVLAGKGYTIPMYGTPTGKFVEPAVVCSHFHLRPGDMVADFGAGSGHYMRPLSNLVGAHGRVYLCEIQKNLVEALGNQAREQRLRNVHPLWCDFETVGGTKLMEGVLDAALLSNTLFQVVDKVSTLGEIARVTRMGGKLIIIDWSDSFGGLGPRSDHIVPLDEARRLVEQVGFVFDRSFPAGEHHYGFTAHKG